MPKEILYFSWTDFFKPTIVEVIIPLSAEVRDRCRRRL
jgi:hypothetical protein